MLILIVLFIVVPIAELYVIIQVGQWIGVLPTLALLLADAILGSMLLRHQGRSAWRRFNEALAQNRFPGKEVADGVMITVGGTLLVTPGFLSDIVGLTLLIPPTRALTRGFVTRFLGWRFKLVSGPAQWGYSKMGGRGGGSGTPPPGADAGQWPPSARPGSPDFDVEGEAREVPIDPKALPSNGARHEDSADDPGRTPPPR